MLADLAELVGREPLYLSSTLAFDRTGGGRPLGDWLREAEFTGKLRGLGGRPIGYTITGGHEPSRRNVPKAALVTQLQLVLQEGRLKIAQELPLREALQRELLSFRAKMAPSGAATYEAQRESDHDDLVTALSLAIYHAHRETGIGDPRIIRVDGTEVGDEIPDPPPPRGAVPTTAP